MRILRALELVSLCECIYGLESFGNDIGMKKAHNVFLSLARSFGHGIGWAY